MHQWAKEFAKGKGEEPNTSGEGNRMLWDIFNFFIILPGYRFEMEFSPVEIYFRQVDNPNPPPYQSEITARLIYKDPIDREKVEKLMSLQRSLLPGYEPKMPPTGPVPNKRVLWRSDEANGELSNTENVTNSEGEVHATFTARTDDVPAALRLPKWKKITGASIKIEASMDITPSRSSVWDGHLDIWDDVEPFLREADLIAHRTEAITIYFWRTVPKELLLDSLVEWEGCEHHGEPNFSRSSVSCIIPLEKESSSQQWSGQSLLSYDSFDFKPASAHDKLVSVKLNPGLVRATVKMDSTSGEPIVELQFNIASWTREEITLLTRDPAIGREPPPKIYEFYQWFNCFCELLPKFASQAGGQKNPFLPFRITNWKYDHATDSTMNELSQMVQIKREYTEAENARSTAIGKLLDGNLATKTYEGGTSDSKGNKIKGKIRLQLRFGMEGGIYIPEWGLAELKDFKTHQ